MASGPSASQPKRSSLMDLPDDILRIVLRQTGLLRPCATSILKERSRLRQLRKTGGYERKCNKLPFFSSPQDEGIHIPYESREGREPLQPCSLECILRHGRFLPSNQIPCFVEDHFGSQQPYCGHPPFPLAVLLVCKRLNNIGTNILYGENTVCLNVWDRNATDRFTRLRTEILATTHNLHVFYSPTCDAITLIENLHKQDLKHSESLSREYQERWARICSMLARTPSTSLTLTLESFPVDIHTAKQMLEPLTGIFVKDLRLNLGPYVPAGRGLSRIMRKTVDRCTSIERTIARPLLEPSFPFESLPVELQERVLYHTGLVITPNSLGKQRVEVLGIRVQYKPRPLVDGCCGTCNSSIFANCLCHTNYRYTFSSTCTCDRLPDALFRVSRNVAEMARRVFYSSNQFYVTGHPNKMIRHIRGITNNLRLVKFFCIDISVDYDLRNWNKPWIRRSIDKLLKFLYQYGHPDLSIKITSRHHMMIGLSNIYIDKESSELRIFCDWLEQCNYTRVSVTARFSKDRGGNKCQNWDTLFVVGRKGNTPWVSDDDEDISDPDERLIRWYPYGAEWKNVIIGAIYGPKVPLLS